VKFGPQRKKEVGEKRKKTEEEIVFERNPKIAETLEELLAVIVIM
jgi:hypothetical protein